MSEIRTIDDLERAVRALSVIFNTDTVVIIGSQSVLLEWPDAPELMRSSGEIDAYPGNIREWEEKNPGDLASEEINALLGWGSSFHETHGFYVDGVDETTAKLPSDWKERAIKIEVDPYGKKVTAIAPCPEDMVASKLNRLSEKDREYIRARNDVRPLNLEKLKIRFRDTHPDFDILRAGLSFLKSLETEDTPEGPSI